jgi:hypothetical protein
MSQKLLQFSCTNIIILKESQIYNTQVRQVFYHAQVCFNG